ncbi:MAG: PhzF family phenazine biosynthesis protein [Pseudomonadota bacterium]
MNQRNIMDVKRIAAFSYNNQGGNPAGVMICENMPNDAEMLNIAKQVGYSETAFLQPEKDGWRIRYFAPEIEVPFCGHATIASGSALGEHASLGIHKLYLNQGEISVRVAQTEGGVFTTTLQSPGTWSKPVSQNVLDSVLKTFNFSAGDLDADFPVHIAFAGARHLILVLQERKMLAEMSYDYEQLKTIMLEQELVTINLLWPESNQRFHARNPFPPGGVYEDPATGAAAAAFAGYLRDIGWHGGNQFEVLQGHDMGVPSRLFVEFSNTVGEGISVTGETRDL